MPFFDHIDELRKRLMRALMVFLVGFAACYFVSEPIMEFLRQPLFDALPPEQQKLYFTHLFENFFTHLKIAGYASAALLAPYLLWELWGFVSPGLYPKERKLALPFILGATAFFVGGGAFAYYGLFPVGFKYFVSYGGPSDFPMLTIDAYYSTVLKLMMLFGLAFELPVVITLLGALGVIDATLLRTQRRTAIIMITIVSALVAPPDAISMILLGAPLVLLYEGSIWVVQWLGVRRKAQEAAAGVVPAPAEAPAHPWEGQSKP